MYNILICNAYIQREGEYIFPVILLPFLPFLKFNIFFKVYLNLQYASKSNHRHLSTRPNKQGNFKNTLCHLMNNLQK